MRFIKKIVVILLLVISIVMTTGCNNKIDKIKDAGNDINVIESNSNEVIKTVKAIINGNEYTINLNNNETVRSFLKLLPLELDMRELNGNEKYFYLDTTLPTNSFNPKHINVGDVMLYDDNCLVLFYKSFDTSYSYTKIGLIDNLPSLSNKNIIVKFEE